ncbi:MAG: methionine--tRNA ligase [Candidatus Muproteobacteria bacterium RBG_16_60_9]|uniref:Methionine--tRNA ligase n=1 Tax=Candidatus Muproteobacteria bacterium RBG_16_60_9 TaxID=1817755 RepID=A0A1F6UW12_9PROT|nr:MAG: methionine--tRNA ligase [Candidatus Muproteobacteria bacterium RBG_16_60_9]
MPDQKRRIFLSSALPYANGPIHIGHLVGYIQADIWVRFQRMQGHTVHYVCADDTHGTPIMLRAEKDGVTPKQLIARMHQEHLHDFTGFHVGFDNYYSTDTPENQQLCEDIYAKLKTKDLIAVRSVENFFDPAKQMFLPDRYIKGECPKCGAKDQYGDSCEVCGATYAPTDLKNPYSVVSGEKPIRKSSEHFFFRLSDQRCVEFLKKWTRSGTLQPEAANKMDEWFTAGLQDWDISRDAPYFGFPIPGTDGKKFFYVWLDAPVGYFASFKNYCDRETKQGRAIDFAAFTDSTNAAAEKTEMVHFIGKDILYFHALFWPAMLQHAGYRTPTKLAVNGFLTVNGEKMSKSRGTFITAESYLAHGLNPEWLRYYYAAKSNGTMEDIDLSFDDFVARVNSDLVGKLVNIASRTAGFITKKFRGNVLCKQNWQERVDSALQLIPVGAHTDLSVANEEWESQYREALWKKESLSTEDVLEKIFAARNDISKLYDERDYSKVIRVVMHLADLTNWYIDRHKPWELAKTNSENDSQLHEICSASLNAFRVLVTYLKPILPKLAESVEMFLGVPALSWEDTRRLLADAHKINNYEHLASRIETRQINALVEANKESLQPAPQAHSQQRHAQHQEHIVEAATQPTAISIDDFSKVDLRIARIVKAEHVEGAEKLLKLTLDIGSGQRTVFAGIKSAYDPTQLEGRLTVMVANLAPRKMKFGLSEGMVLAASDPDGKAPGIFLLTPDSGAQPGMRVK